MQRQHTNLELARSRQEMSQASYNSSTSYTTTMTHRDDSMFKEYLMEQKGLNSEDAIRFMEHGNRNEVNMYAEKFSQKEMPPSVRRNNQHYDKKNYDIGSGNTTLVKKGHTAIDHKARQTGNDLPQKKEAMRSEHFSNHSVDGFDITNQIDSKILNHQKVIQEQKMKNIDAKQLATQEVDQADAKAIVRNSKVGRELGIGRIKQHDHEDED
jgi:hypothetical protein